MSDQSEPMTLVFEVIRRYAVPEGWIPIGWRAFDVGPWKVTVNGTREKRDDIPPYHVRIEHREIVAFMLVHPLDRSVGGWGETEATCARAMEAELARASRPVEDAQ